MQKFEKEQRYEPHAKRCFLEKGSLIFN